MTDEQAPNEPRQTMLSVFREVPTFVDLIFTHEHVAHWIPSGEEETIRINVHVLLSMTSYFDDPIKNLRASNEKVIEMPFGYPSLMKSVISWITYGQIEDDFAKIQECVEFCRFYGIKVPNHPDVPIIQRKTNDETEIPYLNEIPNEDDPVSDDDVAGLPDEIRGPPIVASRSLEFNGKLYVRKWQNRQRTGWYYKCAVRSCRGSLFLSADGMREVHCHDSDFCIDGSDCFDCFDIGQAQEIDALMRACIDESKTAFDIFTTFLARNAEVGKSLLKAPLSTVLRYITCLQKEKSTDIMLRESVTGSSHIDKAGVIYQQVVPHQMIIYAFPDFTDRVERVQWLLIDGTFRSCPKSFAQCVTLLSRDEVTGVFFPLCHCLLPDRATRTYQLMFHIIDTHFVFPNLGWVTVDFEEALVVAVKTWVAKKPWKSQVIGCKFHFSKALSKCFRGGKRKQLSDQDKLFIRLFTTTPFMDRKSIEKALNGLSTVKHPHEGFVRYFEKNWMKDDRFLLWNLSNATDVGLISRYTNNGIESFHKQMNNSLSPHPTIGSFLYWAQSCGEERLRMIENSPARDFRLDACKSRDQRQARYLWERLIQSYEIKEKFSVLRFYFVCPGCGTTNVLNGRRNSHLQCENRGCQFSGELLPYSRVLDQVKDSIIKELEAVSEPMTPTAADKFQIEALRRIQFWLETISQGRLTNGDVSYFQELERWIEERIDILVKQNSHQRQVTEHSNSSIIPRELAKTKTRIARLILPARWSLEQEPAATSRPDLPAQWPSVNSQVGQTQNSSEVAQLEKSRELA